MEILPKALEDNNGKISTIELRRRLKGAGVAKEDQVRAVIDRLKFFDWASTTDLEHPIRVHHVQRSFLSEKAFAVWESERDREAEAQAAQEADTSTQEPQQNGSATRRKDEVRLTGYVKDALDNIYTNDWDEKKPCVFNVHQLRPLSDYENVDLIAVQWRSPSKYDIVAIEVKLKFTGQLVQQANNYKRFADRVWIACPVDSPIAEAANWLRNENPRLFDYTISSGIGILACKLLGRRYEVAPVHWPLRNRCDPADREAFLEGYYDHFVEAGVAGPVKMSFL